MPGTQAAKRKKTADMTDSPPKRVTRARAKTTTTDEAAPKPKVTKVTTASAKAVAAKKKPAVPTRAVKRKTRADDEDGEPTEEAAPEQETKPEPVKAKARVKKDVMAEEQKLNAPKTRSRPTKAAVAEVTEHDGPKTRGRPKKAPETESTVEEAQKEVEKRVIVKKTTRARHVPDATETESTVPATRPAAAAQKKAVRFQQEQDKENVPIELNGLKKPAMKSTGLKAKPVRKPATAKATTRGKKATSKESLELEKTKVLPLSPKKVSQVARSDPTISEDELANEKTPIRALSKSPSKQVMSPVRDFGSVSNLNFDQVAPPSSPSKLESTNILTSPARRPPPSPFKDALKSSPKKFQLGDSMTQPVLLSSRTPMKVSLLQESPKRGKLADNMTQPILLPSKSPFKVSLLQESPKRVRIEDRAPQPINSPSKSSFKASLLQSPARRPIASPTKTTNLISPVKSGVKAPVIHATIHSRQGSPSKVPGFSPKSVKRSPSQDTSPDQSVKVHSVTDEEPRIDEEKENDAAPQAESPIMSVAAEVESPSRASVVTFEEPLSFDDTIMIEEDNPASRSDHSVESSKPAETPKIYKGPSFSLGSAALRRVSLESGSEDELASPDKGNGVTPLRRYGVSAQDFGTPAAIDRQHSDMSEDRPLFTPLADQLSSWTASSPSKQNTKSRPRQGRGMFSLGGAGMIVTPEQDVDDIATGSPAKSSFFEDEMAMRDDEEGLENASFAETDVVNEQDLAALQASQESQASQEYGDENAMPSDAELLREEQDRTLTCMPAKAFTPVKKISQQPREIHTVSKVPLRASADDSPLLVPRQRSRSLGGPLSVVHEIHYSSSRPSMVPEDAERENLTLDQPATPVLVATTIPQTPGSALRLDFETPGTTAQKAVVPDVLQGAVVFVDVHTSEGADASGIFVDLLTQMGARCVKQWSWNPGASMGSSLDSITPQAASPDTAKVGITHVVYKDGGKRTMEKVRSSNGVVSCVGVGWVLE